MAKIKLEMELEELKGINALFRIKGEELYEGSIVTIIDGFIELNNDIKSRWVAEADVEVLKVLFRR